LSLGGCYIETASPFPERTQVILMLSADGVEFKNLGLVRVMHPGRGMGVEFAMRTPEQRQQTEEFINFLVGRPGVEPKLRVAPRPLSADEDNPFLRNRTNGSEAVEDPLLDLLRNHESFSEEMFLQALRSQRSADFVESESN
jgi:hypothetical protein